MARLPRLCLPGIPQHIVQRGTNRQACFASKEDMATYANRLGEYACKFNIAIHAWVFMTNHVHLLVTPETDTGVSRMMQSIGRRYVRYFNYTYRRSGTLWEGRFKSCAVEAESYLLACQRYIELNPVRAGMVDDPSEYTWSSYRSNALGLVSNLLTPHRVYLELGAATDERCAAYRGLFTGHLDPQIIDRIRSSANKGLALGSEQFLDEIENLSGRRVRPLKKGPKPGRQDRDDALS